MMIGSCPTLLQDWSSLTIGTNSVSKHRQWRTNFDHFDVVQSCFVLAHEVWSRRTLKKIVEICGTLVWRSFKSSLFYFYLYFIFLVLLWSIIFPNPSSYHRNDKNWSDCHLLYKISPMGRKKGQWKISHNIWDIWLWMKDLRSDPV